MDYEERGTTFGSYVAERRKLRFLTRDGLRVRLPVRVLTLRQLNDLEQDRLDPRSHPRYEQIITGLAEALQVDAERLRRLADNYPHAACKRRELDERLAFEAVAFRARNERG